MKKSTLTVFFILAGCMLFLSGIWIYFQKTLDKVDLGEREGAASYEKHYLMISGEENTLMWDSIYKSASAAAKDADAYVEQITLGHDSGYTKADYLQIGIASKVDGIILEADGSSEEQKLIQEATDQNIPVVTVLTDDSSSARISFVGLNSYQLGNAYTEQILGLLKKHETTQVLLLSNSQSKTQETNLVYYQIKKELEEKKKDYQSVNISEYSIDSSSDFDTEEFVRDIFVSGETLPDVLVCMDEVVTECVYQALVDYNEVGNVDVVGFYYSDVILDAISKGIISSAIALDMEEIGRYSINALEEYSSLGHTSSYYSVGQHVITRGNVGIYRTEGN
ncbi:substrate-binding domain-containing protein [Blautia sp. HCP3S3_H10_1]|uniref:substrate-binding domain-containing protein n=1 Tax=unclassified Blautia TaxID=2648079 RepID=UPI003F9275DF|nr:substrate-binding domain-containing protein [Clostridia bacterium]